MSATSTAARAAGYVPSTSGVAVSKHQRPIRPLGVRGSRPGPMPSRYAGRGNVSGKTSAAIAALLKKQ